jgi:hypothetical protein
MTSRPIFKIVLILLAVVVISAFVFFISIMGPMMIDGVRSVFQRRALQNRSDYPQIALACVTLARSMTNDSLIPITDPRLPALMKSLSPRYIVASSNDVTLEFHGGFDHYGYRVRPSQADPSQWTIFYYTEHGEKPLATINKD